MAKRVRNLGFFGGGLTVFFVLVFAGTSFFWGVEEANAAVTYVNSSSECGIAASAPVGVPAGTADGDVMLMILNYKNIFGTLSIPAGWTAAGNQINSSNGGAPGSVRARVFWRVASSEPASYTIAWPSALSHCVGIVAFRGVDTGSPIVGYSGRNNATSSSVTATAISPTVADSMVVFLAAVADDFALSGWSGTNPTFTEWLDVGTTAGTDNQIGIASGVKTDTTTTGNRTASIGGSVRSVGFLVALNPYLPPPPPANAVALQGYVWMDVPQSAGDAEGAGWVRFNGANYGVYVENGTGMFSGYAWTSNLGWLSFNVGELVGCPTAPCEAKLNADNTVSGWARFLAGNPPEGGWDGWVRLSASPTYGVTYDPSTGNFLGWAWGSQVGGWMSWNCANQGVCAQSAYGITDGGVTINPNPPDSPSDPDTPGSGTPDIAEVDQCTAPLSYNLRWAFTDPDVGDSQSAYQIQIDDTAAFTTPPALVYDSGKITSASEQFTLPGGILSYNSTYYWRVRVWDDGDNMSQWGNGDNITTPNHAYPTANFSWNPPAPSMLEAVDFTDLSGAAPSYAIDSWAWTFQDGTPGTASIQNPLDVAFATGSQTKLVTLVVSDNSGQNFTCGTSRNILFKPPLPDFREVVPRP